MGDPFDLLVDAVRSHFASTVTKHGPHLFTVDAGDLYAVYLAALPVEARQEHTCNACRSFFDRYGNLVAITENGDTVPAMWPIRSGADLYDDAVAALRRAVSAAKVTGVFLSSSSVWGKPLTGEWTHLAVSPSTPMFRHPLMSADQAMAEKHEHFGTLSRALAEFSPELVGQALTFLDAESLYREEKVAGPARFIHQLQEARARVQSKDRTGAKRRNLVWRAVAGAPAGFCTPRSSMIGTLLEDMAAGLPFEDVKAKFASKMHPLRYQRPQVEAGAVNIAQAEKIVAQLGLEPSLRRRFARLDEVETIWTPSPAPAQEKAGGVFGHLKAKGSADERIAIQQEPVPITWDKFTRTVLPGALEMHLYTESNMSFGALVTAVDPDAPPLLQWDREGNRNPVSGYQYFHGSSPSAWHLDSHVWVRVTGLALMPSTWKGYQWADHHGKGAILLLEGARDMTNPTLALFPETLRAELHSVRKVIEQFSKSRRIEGVEDASACGLLLGKENSRHRLRVRSATGLAIYHIDRWD
jgi:hypothetical protein